MAPLTAREGNSFSAEFPERKPTGKSTSLQCLNDAIEHSGRSAKELAADCGISESQFAKARREAAGGGPLSAFIDALPGEIRDDYAERLREQDADTARRQAAEALAHAAVRFLSVCGNKKPAKAGLK